MRAVVLRLAARFGVDERAQVEQVGLVEPIGGEARNQLLEGEARLEHFVEPGVDAVEVQDRRRR